MTEFEPLAIVPVKGVFKVPVPVLRVRVTSVFEITFTGWLPASCDCMTTLKPVPAIGFKPPFTEVIASLLATAVFVVTVTVPVVGAK